jgi:hypothetical protein
MIRKLILTGLVFSVFNVTFAQRQELTWKFQDLNPDSLHADSIKRIDAFPEYFRPYVQELSQLELHVDQVIRIKKDYKDYHVVFVREFLEPWNPFMFGTPISTDTLLLNDSIRKKLDHILRHENYFGFTNDKLTFATQLTIKQLENVTVYTFISADRKAILFYESVDSEDPQKYFPMLYYYYESVLVAVGISERVFTTETELSQFSSKRSMPQIIAILFELEEYIKKMGKQ